MRTIRSSKGSAGQKSPPAIYVIFCLLALFSALGLDFISWKSGEKSYFFSLLYEEKVSEPVIPADQIVLAHLSRIGIQQDAISQFQDQSGADHLKVDLMLTQYKNIEPRLTTDLHDAQALITKKEEQEDQEKNYFLWEVIGADKTKLAILFSCAKVPSEIPEETAEQKPISRVALIMDDMGYSLDAIYDVLSLEEPITVAIIPYSPLGVQTAQIANQSGLEILLHLPLESINNEAEYNGIRGMIRTDMTVQEIIAVVEEDLNQIPYISGVNNHMGSAVTPNESIMQTILERLKGKNLFFVDSRTTGKTVAFDVARRLNIPTAQRHVFLDTETDEDYIKEKLLELFTLAQQRGEAVGICHPLPSTMKVLKDYFRFADIYDVKPVFVSELVR
jgi:polysaccharide deacetylase 2 family uncharacterized protein YibQ